MRKTMSDPSRADQLTTAEAVLSALGAAPHPLSAIDLAKRTGKNYNTVRSVLRTLFKQGHVWALNDQTYCLPGAFPEVAGRLGIQPRGGPAGEGHPNDAAQIAALEARVAELEGELRRYTAKPLPADEQREALQGRRTDDDRFAEWIDSVETSDRPAPQTTALLLGLEIRIEGEPSFIADWLIQGRKRRIVIHAGPPGGGPGSAGGGSGEAT